MRNAKHFVRVVPPVLRMLKEPRALQAICSRRIAKGQLNADKHLARLGITEILGELLLPDLPWLPPALGRFTKWNRGGRIVKRKDLPKETVRKDVDTTITDWHGNSHNVVQSRRYQRYPREGFPPKNYTLNIKIKPDSTNWLMTFECNQPFHTDQSGWQDGLVFQMSLLLELFGDVDVVDAENGISYYSLSKRNWEVLPPGRHSFEEIIEALTKRIQRRPGDSKRSIDAERLRHLYAYGPEFTAVGDHEFSGYCVFAFKVEDDTIYVLENAEIGNAIYSFQGDWETLSQLTKRQLLATVGVHARRIKHVANWKLQVHDLLRPAKALNM